MCGINYLPAASGAILHPPLWPSDLTNLSLERDDVAASLDEVPPLASGTCEERSREASCDR